MLSVIETLKIAKQAGFYSLLMDGSTDLAGDEQETIYIRTAVAGRVTERFVAVGSPENTTSQGLEDYVNKFLESHDLDKSITNIQNISF